MTIDQLRQRFLDPPADDRMWPFWFWNDDLDEAGLVAQIEAFAERGLGGFVIHPRLGLSREVGYLTDRWLELVRAAVEAAARLGLKVLLYDEGMYPSGCAHGRVTADHPERRARGLQRLVREVTGPAREYWRPLGEEYDDRLLAVSVTPVDPHGRPDYSVARPLEVLERDLVRVELGAGHWRLEAFLDVPSGGHARGVHVGEDDRDAAAPPAANLLDPDAVRAFLDATHEVYFAAVGDHFGETIVGFFTDEPSLLGRGPRRGGLRPWTTGFEERFRRTVGRDLVPLLTALFDDQHPQAATVRAAYERVLAELLNETFYGPLAEWCEAHGVALAGHPSESDDLTALERFTWPGQDIVWRYVEPGRSALEGPHSTAARAATSAKRLYGRERAATECAGAYGWTLTADELKWVFDWHLARGNDLVIPHAFYASVAGPRAYERPPCVGPNSAWWPHFRLFGDYVGRVCALRRAAETVVETAIACDPHHLPWAAAKVLQQRQVDFDYVPAGDEEALSRYAEVVYDGVPPADRAITPEATGYRVLETEPALPDLRAWRGVAGDAHLVYLVNEGERPLSADAWLAPAGRLERWDPWTGRMEPLGAEVDGSRVRFRLELGRREGVFVLLDPDGSPEPPAPARRYEPFAVTDDWEWFRDGAWRPTCLADWCEHRELETFSGTIAYRARVELPAGHWRLDLGGVGELAVVTIDGRAQGVRLWSPYRFDLELAGGEHEVIVAVTNSRANELTGALRPSGLFGPVTWLYDQNGTA